MINRFEKLTSGISQIYKGIQKIKKHKMNSLGLKGTHVMCLYHLSTHADGLTATDLCHLCGEDKAGISRILADLEKDGFLFYASPGTGKKYRAKAYLTEAGKQQSEKLNDIILHAVSQIGEGITDEERETFYKVLFQISDNVRNICLELDNRDDAEISNL
jgi:DNA-binding MarR family transcriptional regulator